MAKTKDDLTIKEAKIVKAKAQGKTHIQAAKVADYLPNANDNTKQVEVARTLKKPHVKQALHKALKAKGITLDKALEPVAKALNAKKVVQIEGDFYETEVDDLDMQIKGSDRALKLMGVSGKDDSGNTYNFTQIINEKGGRYAD